MLSCEIDASVVTSISLLIDASRMVPLSSVTELMLSGGFRGGAKGAVAPPS